MAQAIPRIASAKHRLRRRDARTRIACVGALCL